MMKWNNQGTKYRKELFGIQATFWTKKSGTRSLAFRFDGPPPVSVSYLPRRRPDTNERTLALYGLKGTCERSASLRYQQHTSPYPYFTRAILFVVVTVPALTA